MTTKAPLWPWHGVEKGPLTRFFLVNTRWFGIYLHRINRQDFDREPHDHPWTFVSLVLRGWYVEERRDHRGTRTESLRTWLSLAWRHYSAAHRITMVAPHTWTLILRGRDRRAWGFYLEDQRGFTLWVPWQRFEAARRRT